MPSIGTERLGDRGHGGVIHDRDRDFLQLHAADFERVDRLQGGHAEEREAGGLVVLLGVGDAGFLGELRVDEIGRRAGVEDQAVGPLAVDLHLNRHVPRLEQLEGHDDRRRFRLVLSREVLSASDGAGRAMKAARSSNRMEVFMVTAPFRVRLSVPRSCRRA